MNVMKKDLELVFILDRSGSMEGLERDTIGGFNSMLEKQKKVEGTCIVSTVLFDHEFEVLHNRVDLHKVKAMTSNDYYVRGSTALLDAIGRSIRKIANIHRHMTKDERPEKVLFVITTDGMENASHEFNYQDIKKMIEIESEEYGWEFLFLGSNIDAIAEAKKMGIRKDRATNYHPDEEGTIINYDTLSHAIHSFRVNDSISENWNADILEKYTRGTKKKK